MRFPAPLQVLLSLAQRAPHTSCRSHHSLPQHLSVRPLALAPPPLHPGRRTHPALRPWLPALVNSAARRAHTPTNPGPALGLSACAG